MQTINVEQTPYYSSKIEQLVLLQCLQQQSFREKFNNLVEYVQKEFLYYDFPTILLALMKSEEIYNIYINNLNLITNIICLQFIYNQDIQLDIENKKQAEYSLDDIKQSLQSVNTEDLMKQIKTKNDRQQQQLLKLYDFIQQIRLIKCQQANIYIDYKILLNIKNISKKSFNDDEIKEYIFTTQYQQQIFEYEPQMQNILSQILYNQQAEQDTLQQIRQYLLSLNSNSSKTDEINNFCYLIQQRCDRLLIKTSNIKLSVNQLLRYVLGDQFINNQLTQIVTPNDLCILFYNQQIFESSDYIILPTEIQYISINNSTYFILIYNFQEGLSSEIDKYLELCNYEAIRSQISSLQRFSEYQYLFTNLLSSIITNNMYIKDIQSQDPQIYLPICNNYDLRLKLPQKYLLEQLFCQYALEYVFIQFLCNNYIYFNYKKQSVKTLTILESKLKDLHYIVYNNYYNKLKYLKLNFDNYLIQFCNSVIPLIVYYDIGQNQLQCNYNILIYSILHYGILGIDHLKIISFCELKSNYFQTFPYQINLTFYTLLNMVQQYFCKPANSSQYKQHKEYTTFNEFIANESQAKNIIYFFKTNQSLEQNKCQFAFNQEITRENAIQILVTAIHFINNLQRYSYVSKIHDDTPILPQVLAATTSISPLYQTIHFSIENQSGIDYGGIFKAILTKSFEELKNQQKITIDDLKKLQTKGEFSNRTIDFDKENHGLDLPIFQAVDTTEKTIFYPLYLGFTPPTSSYVLPRLTEKRSCIYYLGRLCAFCMLYNQKIPDMLCDNFYKAITGGRLFFDEQLNKQYKEELQRSFMFSINGTKPYTELKYTLSLQQVKQVYKKWYDIFTILINNPQIDLDMLCFDQFFIEILQTLYKINIQDIKQLRQYAYTALQSMQNGTSYCKFYSEFRNGFRHPFSTSMISTSSDDNQYEIYKDIALIIDKCLDKIDYLVLKQYLTYEVSQIEQTDEQRNKIIQKLMAKNYIDYQCKIQSLEVEDQSDQYYIQLLDKINATLQNQQLISYKQLEDFVFAFSGQRNFDTVELSINFIKPSNQKRLILFHTCFNQIDINPQMVANMSQEQLANFINECVQLALKSGFSIA